MHNLYGKCIKNNTFLNFDYSFSQLHAFYLYAMDPEVT